MILKAHEPSLLEQARLFVQKQVSAKRFQHVLGVVETAVMLARAHGVDASPVELAAMLHDSAKELPRPLQKKLVEEAGEWSEDLQFAPALWHAPAGAWMAQKEFGLTPEEASPIRWHTTGKADMTQEELILYVADQLEPSRPWADDKDRELAKKSLEKAALKILRMKMEYTLGQRKILHPKSVECWNWLLGIVA